MYKIWHAQYAAFPRTSRFTLGVKIDAIATDLIELLLLAGYAGSDKKYALVAQAAAKLDLLKFFLQVAWEVRCLDHKKYAALSVPLNDIGKEIGSWQKYLQTKQPPPA